MDPKDPKLRELWRRANPPVIFRRSGSYPLLVRLPFGTNNYSWLRGDKRHKPKWDAKFNCWQTPVAWYDRLAQRLLKQYDSVYLIQLYRELQKCAPACRDAKGLHCECSCMGENHGAESLDSRWHEVSDTFAFKWGELEYACRLLTPMSKG